MINRRMLLRPFRPVINFFPGHLVDTTATRAEAVKMVKSPKSLARTLMLTVVILVAVLPVYAEANGEEGDEKDTSLPVDSANLNEAMADESNTYNEKIEQEIDDSQDTLYTDNVIEETKTNLNKHSGDLRDNVIKETASSLENEHEAHQSDVLQNPDQDLTEPSKKEDGLENDSTEAPRESQGSTSLEESSSNNDATSNIEQSDGSQTQSENKDTENGDEDLNIEPVLASSASYILAEENLKDKTESLAKDSSESASDEIDKKGNTGQEDLNKLIDELANEEKVDTLQNEDEKRSSEGKGETVKKEEERDAGRHEESSHGSKDEGLQEDIEDGNKEHEDSTNEITDQHLQTEVPKEAEERKESEIKDEIPQTSDVREAAEKTEFDSIISDDGGVKLDQGSSPKTMSDIISEKGEEHDSKNDENTSPESSKVDNIDKSSIEQGQSKQSEKEDKEGQSKEEKTEPKAPGQELFDEAMGLLNQSKKYYKKAFKLLASAADMNNTAAMGKVGFKYMLGDYLPRNITKAAEIFHKLADKGVPVGQQGLAFMYGTGTGVNSSQAKALIYTTFAALGNGVMAQMMLGYRYWGGIGVIQNCESALTHYKKVSKNVAQEVQPVGSPAVHRIRLYDELEQGSSGGNLDDDLLQYYQFLADKGDVQAQVGLGQLYFQGARGVDVDHQKAFQYFKQAADAGNANAQAYLGKMYLEGGNAVPQDNETALKYFTSAVEQGNPIGHSGLGLIYLRGSGVSKDYAKAISHFNLAAEQSWPEAQLQLGNMYYHGLGVSRDYQKAVKYFTLASQSGNVLAVYNLASMHASGNGVLRSCHTATELFKSVAERGKWSSWFTEAYTAYKAGDIETALIKYYVLAELGYEAAQSNVAYILDKGESSLYAKNESYARALLQWSRAAGQGYTVARVKVGDYHFYGLGTEIDYEVAALHYRLASEQQNNAQAMFNLGYMHEQGLGLKKDIHLAKRFYDMAAESNPDAQVPVALAMVKLGAYFTLEWAHQNYKFWEKYNIKELLGKDWDLYVITGLAILLGLILLIRRTQA